MAHPAQQNFCKYVKSKFPSHFTDKTILDVGSLDINGNNRYLFENCEYTGLDLCEGKNVDVVCHLLDYRPDKAFDVVISTEAIEHDSKWDLTLARMTQYLQSNGLLILTCATGLRAPHGVYKHNPTDSPKTNNWYRNLDIYDLLSAIDFGGQFKHFEIESTDKDLYLWGVKK